MRSISFDPEAWDDFQFWLATDLKIARRIFASSARSNAIRSAGSANRNPTRVNSRILVSSDNRRTSAGVPRERRKSNPERPSTTIRFAVSVHRRHARERIAAAAISGGGLELSADAATLLFMDPGDLEPRVAALEHQVRDLAGQVQASQQDAAAARVLAGAADRDVSGFRDDLREFRQATVGLQRAPRGLCRPSIGLRALQGHVDQGFTEMRGKFDAAAAGQQQIVDLLETIITDQEHKPSTE